MDAATAHELLRSVDTNDVGGVLAALSNGADINRVNEDGRTALIRAISNGKVACVRVLLEKQADVNAVDKNGRTALMHAAVKGNEACLRSLLEKQADVNAVDKNGSTALMRAAYKGNEACLRILLEKQADVNAVEKGGRTALMIAAFYGHPSCVAILEQVEEPPPPVLLLPPQEAEVPNVQPDHPMPPDENDAEMELENTNEDVSFIDLTGDEVEPTAPQTVFPEQRPPSQLNSAGQARPTASQISGAGGLVKLAQGIGKKQMQSELRVWRGIARTIPRDNPDFDMLVALADTDDLTQRIGSMEVDAEQQHPSINEPQQQEAIPRPRAEQPSTHFSPPQPAIPRPTPHVPTGSHASSANEADASNSAKKRKKVLLSTDGLPEARQIEFQLQDKMNWLELKLEKEHAEVEELKAVVAEKDQEHAAAFELITNQHADLQAVMAREHRRVLQEQQEQLQRQIDAAKAAEQNAITQARAAQAEMARQNRLVQEQQQQLQQQQSQLQDAQAAERNANTRARAAEAAKAALIQEWDELNKNFAANRSTSFSSCSAR